MGVRCGWGLVAASPLWVFRGPDLPAHELPIRFMGARREKNSGKSLSEALSETLSNFQNCGRIGAL